jgi:hypothetical protein
MQPNYSFPGPGIRAQDRVDRALLHFHGAVNVLTASSTTSGGDVSTKSEIENEVQLRATRVGLEGGSCEANHRICEPS